MQLAVLSSQGPPVSLPSLKKHFLLRNISNNYPIAVHYNHKPCSNINKQQKPSEKKLEALQIMQENFYLEHILALHFFTDLSFTIVLLEHI